MKICPTCKFQNTDDTSRYCQGCGSTLPTNLPPDQPFSSAISCPRCHKVNPPGTRFCGNCAAPLTQSVNVQQYAHPAPPPAQPKKKSSMSGCGVAALIVGGIFAVLIIGPVILIGIGTYIQNAQSAANKSNTNATTKITQTVKPTTATTAATTTEEVIEISVEDLTAAFEDNSIAAKNKYDGKLVRVTGVIVGIGENIFKKTYVTIGEDEYSWGSVYCNFSSDSEIQKVAELHDEDEVTITGRLTYTSISINLDDCIIE